MLYYIYYSYIAYNAWRYAYLLEYGYNTVKYVGKAYSYIVPGEDEHIKEIERDWVLCDVDDPQTNVVVMDPL